MDEIMSTFLIECSESLAQLDQDLVVLEKNADDKDLLNRIFRAMHTIKGSCGLFDLHRMERIAHLAEDVLGKLREGLLPVSPQLIGPILAVIDIVKGILVALEHTGKEPAGDDSVVIGQLNALLGVTSLKTAESEPAILEAVDFKSVEDQPVSAKAGGNISDQSLRVNIDVLDSLMNMVGELVLVRNQLTQLVQSEEESKFIHPIQHLNRVTSGLQESVMKTRMQPIGNAWGNLTRIVRDLAQTSEKKIELIMTGQDTEIDRQVLQAIKDPLVHCVRNSADHGIEDSEVRRTHGKSAAGKIHLNAFHEGGHIVIEIKDDGAGINTGLIRKKAVEKGLVKPDQIDSYTEQKVLQLIFEPGFSTAQKVTEVSGRGVGMDVVRTNIEKIGGQVNIFSKEGLGTTIQMKIPLTLAIISALIVGVEGESYAIPQVGVLELVRVSETNSHLIEEIHGSKLFRLRDRLLPLIHLSSVVRSNRSQMKSEPMNLANKDLVIVVAQVGATVFGVCVDEIFDTQEIVVKSVGRLIREVNLFSGATILGDGRLVLILDTARIAERTLSINTDLASTTDSDDVQLDAHSEKTTLLLFRSLGEAPKAVPLALVARLEEFSLANIERVDGKNFTQYRNALLPLIHCNDFDKSGAAISNHSALNTTATIPAIIFSDGRRSMGLIVTEILDIVEEKLLTQISASKQGVLGAAIISGKATEVIDTYFYLQRAYPDWFTDDAASKNLPPAKILFVDDSAFFREMLRPLLTAKGYQVTLANNGAEAWDLLERGEPFDLVLSDIEMPVMDGFALASKVRGCQELSHMPILALTSLASQLDQKKGEAAGFQAFLVKFDRDTVMAAIDQAMSRKRSPGTDIRQSRIS